MWLFNMPMPPKCAEILIKLNTKDGIGAIRIWNYNRSLLESVKGVKELEIIKDGESVW